MENNGDNYPFTTPSSSCVSDDLLFFDTFSHSGTDKHNFDLVQFPSPVVIDLIKIVPLGQPVKAKIPGNVRLGATNPSNCELEFFINDLTKQEAHTMTDLGKFYCSEKETNFSPPLQIQTDGLLLRGSYRTLTLAIFGQIATYDEKIEDDQVVLSATSQPAQTPASPVASERDLPYIVRSVDQGMLKETTRYEPEPLMDSNDMIDDAINDEVTRTIPEETSCSESHPTDLDEGSKRQETEFSDKDRPNRTWTQSESVGANQDDQDPGTSEDEVATDEEWSFNVDAFPPKPLIYFSDPSSTIQEKNALSLISGPELTEYLDKDTERIKYLFSALNCDDDVKSEEWVSLMEDITNDIANMSLNRVVANEALLNFLVEQVCDGLNIETALKQKLTGYKVRHLRAGLKLATLLFHCGDLAVDALLHHSVPHKVLQLYNHDQMSLPIRLLIFKCLSAMCDSITGANHAIYCQYKWRGVKTLLNMVGNNPNADTETLEAQAKVKPESSPTEQADEQKESPIDDQKQCFPESAKITVVDDEEKILTLYQYMVVILLSQPKTRVTLAIGNLLKKIRLFLDLSRLESLCFENYPESEDSVFDSEKASEHRSKLVEQILPLLQDIINLTSDRCSNIAQPVRHLPARVQFQIRPHSSDAYLAVYKWMKNFRSLEAINFLLNIPQPDTEAPTDIEKTIRVQSLCLLLIQKLSNSPRGVQFYLSKNLCESTTNLLHTLADKRPAKRSSHLRVSDGIENCLSASSCKEEALLAASCNDLSLKLLYSFKVFSCIDKLLYFHRESISKRGESKLCDPEKVLHQLYILSDHPHGLAAMVKHFSCVGNLDCLLRFIDMSEPNKQLEFVKETSIDYALELIGTFLRVNNNVLEVSEEYLGTLLELCKTKDKTLSVRIKSLIPWMSPFESEQAVPITYCEETFRQLTRVIRRSIPNHSIPFAKGLDFELPPQLITAVRILRQLCIPPQVESFLETNFDIYSMQKLNTSPIRSPSFMSFVDSLPHQQNQNQSWNLNLNVSRNNGCNNSINNIYDDSLNDQLGQISNTFKLFQPYDPSICGELKYHYGIMQLFEQEGLKRLLNTLRELTGNYPNPIYQRAALSGFRGKIVLSYLHSVTLLLHSILCHLIDARGSEFKDTSIIPVILETYSLLCFVPQPETLSQNIEPFKHESLKDLQKSITIRSDNYLMAQQTKKLILSILMSYTQMCLSVSESEEKVISKSMWTQMLKEVIDFTLSTPVFFHHGLDVLTKILPSPLPCSSIMDSIDQEQLFKNINHRKLWSAHLHPLHQQIEQMISQLSLCYQSNIRNLLYYLCNQLCDLSSNAACMVAKIITDTLLHYAAKLCNDTDDSTSAEQHNVSGQIQGSQIEDKQQSTKCATKTQESAYAAKMILNLLTSLITNQAFETAFTNHLQLIGKKDEKLLVNLHDTIKFRDDFLPNDSSKVDQVNPGPCSTSVTVSLVISIHISTIIIRSCDPNPEILSLDAPQ